MNKRVTKEFDKYLDVPSQQFDVDKTPFGSLEKCACHFYSLALNSVMEHIDNELVSMKELEPHSAFRKGQQTAFRQVKGMIRSMKEE